MQRFESAENGKIIYCKSSEELVPSVVEGATYAAEARKTVEQAINRLIDAKDKTSAMTATVTVDFTVSSNRQNFSQNSSQNNLSLVYELTIKLYDSQDQDFVADIAKILEELVR